MAGKTGVRAILSFAITILMIWKVLIPMYLNGYNPVLVGISITTFLTIVIISLVFGFDRMMLSATTLLLAYSGGYVSMLMVFMAQGTPVDNI